MHQIGSENRSKTRIHLWKKATLIHLMFFFVIGFFIGFTPTISTSSFSRKFTTSYQVTNLHISAKPVELLQKRDNIVSLATLDNIPPTTEGKQLIIITTTRVGDPFQEVFLMRMGQTLMLVQQPMLWIVVEAHTEAPKTAKMLRSLGIMYRHLSFKENFTDPDAIAEVDYQRNVALNHIEKHRIDGIVHFAGLFETYDLRFFEEIRDIKVLGTWPVATLSSNSKQVVVEGPICRSSKIVGWQAKDLSTNTTISSDNISNFAFNSSILWSHERSNGPSQLSDTPKDSINFIKKMVLRDKNKLRPISSNCSRIITWHLQGLHPLQVKVRR